MCLIAYQLTPASIFCPIHAFACSPAWLQTWILYFGLWDQILDMGMVDERTLEASLPNQPSSKHKSYMRPLSQLGNGKIVGWKIFSYSLCTRSIRRFPVQNLCFCVGNKLDRLTSSYEGDSWDGGYKIHERPSHQQKSTYFQMKKDGDWLSRNIHKTESWSLYKSKMVPKTLVKKSRVKNTWASFQPFSNLVKINL